MLREPRTGLLWGRALRQKGKPRKLTILGLLFLFSIPIRDLPTFIFRFLGNCFAFYAEFLL